MVVGSVGLFGRLVWFWMHEDASIYTAKAKFCVDTAAAVWSLSLMAGSGWRAAAASIPVVIIIVVVILTISHFVRSGVANVMVTALVDCGCQTDGYGKTG